MRLLNTDESWELLLKTTSMGRTCTQDLEDIGREVLEKCQGLPLAIIVAGGLLVKQRGSKSGWDKILGQMRKCDSEAWGPIQPILELSYQNLPSKLKLCFLCLAFFKENEIIRVGRLVHIWVVLGLVNAEEVAREYLEDLINRNLIFVKEGYTSNEVKYCYVHDLIHDLSIKKANEEMGFDSLISANYDGSSSSSKPVSSNKLRHWVARGTRQMTMWIFSSNKKHIRSLFLEVEDPLDEQFASSSNWKNFEVLRVVDIEMMTPYLPMSFPSAICALIGIKYLRLSVSGALHLPSCLDVLKNLEVIDITCHDVNFPVVKHWKFNSLHYFYIYTFVKIHYGGVGRWSLENIETLKYIDSSNLVEEKYVFGPRLRKLGISLYQVPMERLERFLAGTTVQTLNLRDDYTYDGKWPNLKSMKHLTKVKLIFFESLPPIADTFPQSITHLKICYVSDVKVDVLKELGKLPNLVFLKLDSVEYCENLTVSHKEFPRLNNLHLSRIHVPWSIKVEEGGMAELQRLEIRECPKLHIENLENRIPPPEIIIINDTYL